MMIRSSIFKAFVSRAVLLWQMGQIEQRARPPGGVCISCVFDPKAGCFGGNQHSHEGDK